MHWIRYCFGEAWHSLWRQKGSVALSVLTIAAALLVLGSFLVVTVNLDRLVSRWSAAAEFSIYLRDDITQEQRVAINALLDENAAVTGREFVSKADAMRRFKRDFPDLASGLSDLSQNPLPASIEVRLVPERAGAAAVEAFARRLAAEPGVADVRFDRRWLERLSSLGKAVRWSGWVLGAVLLLASGLTVATVVRLALHARRDEVDIMHLMGAPMSLLRGPLVVEGFLQGGLGAALALALLYAAFEIARAQFAPSLSGLIDTASLGFLPASLSALLVVGGMGVGCLGGLIAARHVR